jgi:hypothetical protein
MGTSLLERFLEEPAREQPFAIGLGRGLVRRSAHYDPRIASSASCMRSQLESVPQAGVIRPGHQWMCTESVSSAYINRDERYSGRALW